VIILSRCIGVESAVGTILDPIGKKELTYAWVLGKTTNNQIEVYALL